MRRTFILLTLLLCIPLTLAAPTDNLRQQFVNDNADIFSPQEEQQLTELLTFIEENATVEFAVVTTADLEGISIEEYSLQVAEHLGIGKEDVDNGLLLLIAPNDRAYRFEVGYGLEGSLPDGRIGNVGRQYLVPAFQEERYFEGTANALTASYGYIVDDPTIISSVENQEAASDISRYVWIIVMLIILANFFMRGGFFFIPMGGGGFRTTGGFGSGGFGGFGGGGFGGGGASGGW